MPRLRPTTRDFLDDASHHVDVSTIIDAPRGAVWQLLADHGTWDRWYPGMTRCETAEPGGPDARRTVTLGPLLAEERWVVWQPENALGFTVERLNLPMARRMFELVELDDEAAGTRIRFRGGYQPHPVARPGFKRSLRTIERSWSTAFAAIEQVTRLTQPQSGPSAI